MTKAGHRKPNPATALEDERHLLHGLEDGLDVVVHRKQKAGRQLSVGEPRVHERRAVGQEVEIPYHLVEVGKADLSVVLCGGAVARVLEFGVGNRTRNPGDEIVEGLLQRAILVLKEVPRFQNLRGRV